MSFLTRLLWRTLPQQDRQAMLGSIPAFQRRNAERVLKGSARYQDCFDRSESLFIHVPKAAGRSVVRGLYDQRSVEHASAEWYAQLDPDRYQRYFSFTFVRNPWDRAVSAYTYLCQNGAPTNEDDSKWGEFVRDFDSFDDFVCRWLNRDTAMRHILFTPQHLFICNVFGELDLDYVGRFERLEEDYQYIAGQVRGSGPLPHLNQSIERPPHYADYYTDASKARVADVYEKDITLLGYTFPD